MLHKDGRFSRNTSFHQGVHNGSRRVCRRYFHRPFVIALLAAVAVLVTVAVPAPGSAVAAAGITLSTSYPGTTVTPGEKVHFTLEIDSQGLPSQKASISVKSQPDGWKTSLEGNGRPVHEVFLKESSTSRVSLSIEVPAEAEPGNYQVVVTASASYSGVRSSLALDLKVSDKADKPRELVTQYPELKGPSTATYRFRVDLTNNTPEEQSFSLGAGAPPGWEVSFSPSYENNQIASLSLESGKSQGLDVTVKPPKMTKAGTYSIPIQAVSPAGVLKTDLRVIITGNYELNLTTPSGRLNTESTAGRETQLKLKIENNGTADVKDVVFSSWEPENWSVRFEPNQLSHVPAGESREVTAFIKPDGKAIAGDYVIRLMAGTRETTSDAIIRVSVKTPTLWGLVGVFIILLVAGGVTYIFRTYGRR